MPGFDLIWLGLCGIYLFQLRKEKGLFYDKMRDIAAKKSTFDKKKFKKTNTSKSFFALGLLLS